MNFQIKRDEIKTTDRKLKRAEIINIIVFLALSLISGLVLGEGINENSIVYKSIGIAIFLVDILTFNVVNIIIETAQRIINKQ